MPPRKKPTSTRQKKAEQQLKRAIKRGDVEAPEPKKKPHHKKKRIGPTGNRIGSAEAASEPVRKLELQSAFIKLSPKFLEETKDVASNSPLPRPLSFDVAILPTVNTGKFEPTSLGCPHRPKWRFDMTKLEVERNEEGLFKKWLAQSDEVVEIWQKELDGERHAAGAQGNTMPASPTYFERNLEVWRQLWRVTEISQIILILIDSRCPDLHFPPSLISYLGNRKIILVLTKVDITGSDRVDGWKAYFGRQHPTIPIVEVESYVQKTETAVHQGKRLFEPSIPDNFRLKFIEAIKNAHSELLEPPEKVKENPKWLKNWVPPVKPDVDWDALIAAKGDNVGLTVGGAAVPRSSAEHDEESPEADPSGSQSEKRSPEFLTIGLIGQPNVGKSSLLNALFGARRVRASKTPGKTKHFQTLFWTSDVRLVDCPGLVVPNFVPMEMQVLAGILPISRVSAVAACVHFASKHLPLERIYQLRHPSLDETPSQDKRTWREGVPRPNSVAQEKETVWTAMDILTAYANAKGWITAKAGRPDVHRAGNAILRALAEGRISWGFWPPGTEPRDSADLGIWIADTESIDTDTESEDEQDDEMKGPESSDDDNEGGADNSSDEDYRQNVGAGRFGALEIDEGQESESSEE